MSDVFHLGTGSMLQSALEKVGFQDVTLTRLQVALKYVNDDAAASAVFEGGPAALPYSRFDAETKKSVKERYLHTIQSYKKPNGSYEIPGEFVIGVGHKKQVH